MQRIKQNFLLILFILGCFTLTQCKKETHDEVIPSIIQLNESQVIISWESNVPYEGKIYYKAAGTEDRPLAISGKLGKATYHDIEIQGLKPSTQYLYWIDGMEKKYHFRTKPVQNEPFAFMMTTDTEKLDYLSALQKEACSFILVFNNSEKSKALNLCNSYTPIFSMDSSVSSFEWSGLQIEVIRHETDLNKISNSSGTHTLGIIVQSALFDNVEKIESSSLHKSILEYNAQHSLTPVSFVGILNSDANMINISDISYVGLAQGKSNSDLNDFTLIINVDLESTSAYFVAADKEILLKEPPLQGKRTCKECRRLAERGAYEESIKAYEYFIESNKGHYQIDDAYFAIAELYDGKLFQFAQALEWYNLLLQDFPSSNLISLANQRVSYISKYNDNDFKPLAAFENIKNHEFASANNLPTKQVEVLEKLAKVIDKYPESKITPVMHLWMANQYQLINVEKAIAAYSNLLEQYPDFSMTNEVPVKMGETYYKNSQWEGALEMFTKAAPDFPYLKETIDSQLKRIKRNIKRVQLNYVTLVILLTILLGLLFVSPFGLKQPGWKSLSAVFIINFVLIFLYCWLYKEEFATIKGMIILVLTFSTSILLGVITAYSFTRKILIKQRFLSIILGDILGLIVLICGFYQGIYHVFTHYLTVVGL